MLTIAAGYVGMRAQEASNVVNRIDGGERVPGEKDRPNTYRVRDPVHGFIDLSEREISVIDTPIFQRLRRIRQLALADLVYPGCTHTRFEHSLGTVHIANQIALVLKNTGTINERDLVPIRMAALLHDLGHGPFSHIAEYILAQYHSAQDIESIHEDVTAGLIRMDRDLKRILGGNLIEDVCDILKGKVGSYIKRDIVSGPLDADKLDYILRDAYYAGVKYGSFDLPKILESMVAIGSGQAACLGINEEGVHAVEQLVMAKHHMTVQVYRHKIRTITDAMIIRALEIAIEAGDDELLRLYKFTNSEQYLRNYCQWWDDKLIAYMLECQIRPARELFERLFQRRLLKIVHKRGINDREMPDVHQRRRFLGLEKRERQRIEKNIALLLKGKEKIDSRHIIVNIVTIKNPTWRFPAEYINEDEIEVQLASGEVKCLKEIQWSVLSLANVEEKQEYVHVYAPGEAWADVGRKQKEKVLKATDKKIALVLYS